MTPAEFEALTGKTPAECEVPTGMTPEEFAKHRRLSTSSALIDKVANPGTSSNRSGDAP